MHGSAPVLRDYQVEAVDSAFKAWGDRIARPVLVLATGAGKTIIFSDLVNQFRSPRGKALDCERNAYGPRVLVLAHRDELIDQAITKLKTVLPFGTRVGKIKAGSNGIGSSAALRVTIHYKFDRSIGSDQIAITEIKLYGDVQALPDGQWDVTGWSNAFVTAGDTSMIARPASAAA